MGFAALVMPGEDRHRQHSSIAWRSRPTISMCRSPTPACCTCCDTTSTSCAKVRGSTLTQRLDDFQTRYFVILGFGVLAVGGAGEIVNVTQVFQPSGRSWLANSR